MFAIVIFVRKRIAFPGKKGAAIVIKSFVVCKEVAGCLFVSIIPVHWGEKMICDCLLAAKDSQVPRVNYRILHWKIAIIFFDCVICIVI